MAVRGPGVGTDPRVPQNRTLRKGIIYLPLSGLQRIRCLEYCDLDSPESRSYTPPMPESQSPRYDARPWGSFTVVDEGSTYKVKRIEVLAQKRLSYQKHAQRAEHWVIVDGVALVTLDGRDYTL